MTERKERFSMEPAGISDREAHAMLETKLLEMIVVLRDALQRAPERYVVQHHGYDQWYLGARTEALELTKEAK